MGERPRRSRMPFGIIASCLILCYPGGPALASGLAPDSALFYTAGSHETPNADLLGPIPRVNARIARAYGDLPLVFTENRGQVDPIVRYTIRGPRASAFFTDTGVTLDLSDGSGARSRPDGHGDPIDRQAVDLTSFTEMEHRAALRMTFGGARPDCRVEGAGELPGRVNILRGRDSSKWQTGIPTFSGVVYRDVWSGIDVSYRGDRNQLKYDIQVNPGADLSDIRLRYEGAEKIWLDKKGDLHIKTAVTTFVETVPGIYQEKDGEKIALRGGYDLLDHQTVGFRVKGVDPSLPLVIDPASDLIYCALIGGNGVTQNGPVPFTYGGGVAVDANGHVYVTGYECASQFPTTPGAYDTTRSATDAFVAKLTQNGSGLLYCTLLGGSQDEQGTAIAVDGNGCAVVAGGTGSPDFPSTPVAYATTLRGAVASPDIFVTKLNAGGSGLVSSTFLGGDNTDYVLAMALDGDGCAYLTGYTQSHDYPTTPGAHDATWRGGGGEEGFVTKLNASLSALSYSTLLLDARPSAIALDTQKCAYLTGQTWGLFLDTTPGAYDTTSNGSLDVFAMKLNADGSVLVYSTLIGGSGYDAAWGIAVDAFGCSYITGYADSTDFPTTPGALNRTSRDATGTNFHDAFVTKLDQAGSSLAYSTLLGGGNSDLGRGVVVDRRGCASVFGWSDSADFPTTSGAFRGTSPGSHSIFVSRVNAGGSGLEYSTFLGVGYPYGMVMDANEYVYLGGSTNSSSFPVTAGAYVTPEHEGSAVFVAKMKLSAPPANVSVSPASGFYPAGPKSVFSTSYSDPKGCTDLNNCYAILNPTLSAANSIELIYNQAINKLYLQNDAGNSWLGGVTPGTAGATIENSRCIVYCGDTTVNASGNDLTVNWKIAFKPTMTGKTCSAWLRVNDKGGLVDEWEKMACSISVGGPPVNVSVSPTSGSYSPGAKLTMSTSYSDPDGRSDLNNCYAIVNPTLSAANSIDLIYNQVTNKLYLQNDAGNTWLGGVTPGTSGATIENSRCIVYCGETTVTGSGSDLTVNWKIAFKPTMAGKSCGVWLRSTDKAGLVDEWERLASGISVGGPPSNVSVSPTGGTYGVGDKLTFSTSYTDPDGYTDLNTCYSILNPTLSAANSVELIYYQPTNALYLQNDAGNVWLGGVTPGTAGATIENSRCIVYCEETTTSGSGSNLTVNWRISLKPPMAGKTCGAWLRVNDRAGLTDEWENMGAVIGITAAQ